MIHVLYVISSLQIGGAENQLLNTVSQLDRSRIQPYVCSLSGIGPLTERFQALDVPVYHLNRRSRTDVGLLVRFVALLRDVRPDVVHSQMLYSNLLTRLAVIFANSPAVICQDHGLSPWKGPFWTTVDRLTSPLVRYHITVSAYSRDLRLRRERFRPEKTLVVYNAVDEVKFDPARFATVYWDGRVPLIMGTVASLKPVKGLDVLFHAVALLFKMGVAVELRLIGDGPERANLEALADKLNVRECVRFLGAHSDIPEQLSQLHVFVLPSVREDLPVSLLEAMAMERACIASQVGGIPEIIQHGINGWLVEPGNAQAIAMVISTIVNQPALAVTAGRAARQTVLDRFTVGQQVQKLTAIYEGICHK